MVQSLAPRLLGRRGHKVDEVRSTRQWGIALAVVSALIAAAVALDIAATAAIVGGLIVFGVVFAMNSSLHSYLVLAYSEADRVSLSVGFYYMANACGRLLGTLLSGILYQVAGVEASLWGAVVLAGLAGAVALLLPAVTADVAWSRAKGDE